MVLRDIEEDGQTFFWDDQEIWTRPLEEFGIACTIIEPITAEIFVLPEKEGCLFRGKLRGKVKMPCDRCTEDTIATISSSFDEFEVYPPQEDDLEDDYEAEDNRVIIIQDDIVMVDFAAILWEEFSLSLPVKPLCGKMCEGMCPKCGKNLNEEFCSCKDDTRDPRMEALQNFKIQ